YGIAGLASALVAGTQIAAGVAVPWVRRLFGRRTDALLVAAVTSVALLAILGLTPSFVLAIVVLALWSFVSALSMPVRQAYLNGVIASDQRATVLSFDSLMGSAGGVVAQPLLGRVADVSGYGMSVVASAAIRTLALPFVLLARRENAPSDPITDEERDDADG
ncbi:MAG: MFS transporter, partial [Candidatus Limnocylindria bacterium]